MNKKPFLTTRETGAIRNDIMFSQTHTLQSLARFGLREKAWTIGKEEEGRGD